MKKFLSLALALIMTLSLVTISAGAAEYKDFTDKDEIQYEEAVAVLNRLGIITGYSEGDFRPEGELTRGAAAKIIVSLLIGPEAAEALPTTASPYPDVPAGNVFAGYISFCKTEKIINGYNDGTFRPTGTLTGFAFAKMLLSALGFDGDVEGFTGSGWTMRVASLGNTAGLFDRISFKGGETVNRETACQLALNTLKATTVEYNGSGSTSITIAGVPVDIGGTQKWSYRTSNQDFATNIKAGDKDNDRNDSDWYTVEFGEEHFVDLRLDHNKYYPVIDDFGRPCVQWSYKRVTIGKYPLAPDFTFTKQMIHTLDDTSDASKLNALNMNGYKVTKDTEFYVNGVTKTVATDGSDLKNTAAIANYTDNGAQVYAYISYKQGQSDVLSHVVVIQSQLMEVKKVGSDFVSLQMYDNGTSDDNLTPLSGYNQKSINQKVADVEVGDNYYNLVKDMKVGDLVVVEPYSADRSGKAGTYEVGRAYAPESVTGVFSHVQTHGTKTENRLAIALTVGGTKYSISQWNKDLNTADENALKVTKKDVTLFLDQFGYPMLGKDIGGTTDWMVISSFRQTMQNGYLVDIVNGFDLDGKEIELNVGPAKNNNTLGYHEGDLVYYKSSTKNTADWEISMSKANGVYDVWTGDYEVNGQTLPYELRTGNSRIALKGFGADVADDKCGLANQDGKMKYVFVSFDDDGEVSSVEILTTKQNVSNADLRGTCQNNSGVHTAQACVKDDGTVKAVVIKRESNGNDNLPIGQIDKYLEDITDTSKTAASVQNDGLNASNVQYASNRIIYRYTATLRTPNGNGSAERQVDVYSYTRLEDGDYFTYSKTEHETYEDFYTLHKIGDETTRRNRTVLNADVWGLDEGDKNELIVGNYFFTGNKVHAYPNLATQKNYESFLNGGEWANIVNISMATITDKTGNGIESVNDLKDWFDDNKDSGKFLNVRMLVNDNAGNDGFRYVYMMTIESDEATYPKTQTKPFIYVDSIESKKDSGKAPAIDVPETEKFSLSIPEGSWAEIVIDGASYKPGDALPKLPAAASVLVKPNDGWEIKGSSLNPDGFYEVLVSKDNPSINLSLVGAGGAGTIKLTETAQGKVASATGSVSKMGSGKATATIAITAPEWARLSNGSSVQATDLTVNYTIVVDGVDYASDKKQSATASTESATAFAPDVTDAKAKVWTITNLDLTGGDSATQADFKAAETVEVRIDNVTWGAVAVKYVADEGTLRGGSGTASLTTANTGANLAYTLDAGYYSAATAWTVTGATVKKDSDGALTGKPSLSGATAMNNLVADGNGYVTVTFSGLTVKADRKFTISGLSNVALADVIETADKSGFTDDQLAGNLVFTVDGDGSTNAGVWTVGTNGSSVTLKVASSGTNAAVAKYIVTIPVKNVATGETKSYTKDVTSTVQPLDILTMDNDFEVVVDDIKAVPVKAFVIADSDGDWTAPKLTISFNNNVKVPATDAEKAALIKCFTDIAGKISVTDVEVSGKDVILTLANVTAGDHGITVTGVTDVDGTVLSGNDVVTFTDNTPVSGMLTVAAANTIVGDGKVFSSYTVSVTSGSDTKEIAVGSPVVVKQGDEITLTLTVGADGIVYGAGSSVGTQANVTFAAASAGKLTIKGTNAAANLVDADSSVTATGAANIITFGGAGAAPKATVAGKGSTFTITYTVGAITAGESLSITAPTYTAAVMS